MKNDDKYRIKKQVNAKSLTYVYIVQLKRNYNGWDDVYTYTNEVDTKEYLKLKKGEEIIEVD